MRYREEGRGHWLRLRHRLRRCADPTQCALICTSVSVLRNPDAWHDKEAKAPHYFISKPVSANGALKEMVSTRLKAAWPKVVEGMDATADSFYSSQGA